MVKKISGYFSLTSLNESKQKKGFVRNGSRRKTRQGTQAALMGLSATVGSGSSAYDAFRKENHEENEDEFKIDLTETGREHPTNSNRKQVTKPVNKMVYNLTPSVQDIQPSDPESSGIPSYGSSNGSYIHSALGKDSDQDSGRISIPDTLSQCSFTDTLSVWDTSIISLSPANSHFNINTEAVHPVDPLPSEIIKATKLEPEKSIPKKEKLKMKVKSLKDKLMGNTKTVPYTFDETVLSIPPDKTVLQWVTEVLTPLVDEEEKNQRFIEDENLQGTHPPNYPVSLYIECLQRCLESGVFPASSVDLSSAALLEKNKHLMDGIDPISYVLRKLKIDLHQAPDSYVVDFLAQPNNGINLLVHLLREILHAEEALTGTTTIQANRKAKHDQYRRNLTDEHDCLLCIKFSLRVKAAIRELLNVPYGLETVAQCLISCFSRARLTALEILTECLSEPSGLTHVLDAFTYVRLKFGEPQRFKMLISILNSAGTRRLSFQAVCMHFFNALLNSTSSLNSRVFLQHQLLLAGLDIDALEKKTDGDSWELSQLQHEVSEWKAKYIDVENLQEEQMVAHNRNALLRQEVDLLQEKMKAVEDEYQMTKNGMLEANKKTEDYQERVFELQEKMEKLMILYEEKTGQLAEKNLPLGDVMRSVEIPDFNQDRRDSAASMASSTSSYIPVPPPIPKKDDPKLSEIKKRMEPKVDLPTLNWVPLTNIQRTVFEELNDDHIYEQLDFADFEFKFQIQKRDSTSSSAKSTKSMAKSVKRLKTLTNNRARNIVITLRRIGHSARQIRDYINLYDTASLPGEYAELLLKFVPTKDEAKTLTNYSEDYLNLDESEQLMYQLAQIERAENKLKVMAFMGQFDDIIEYLNPQIQRITASSRSLCENKKVQKVFEIILAFGNYMNSAKRGFIGGFKLESLQKLSEIKSKDRSETLLEYLVNIIIWYYPHLMAWFDDLNLDLPKSASYQSIAADIFSLRKGIDLVKFEREKNSAENENLENFHGQASTELHVIWESFKEMEEWYKQACSMFGENYKSLDPGVFVSYFSDFAFQFKISLKKCLQSGEEFPVMLMSSPRTLSVNTLCHESTTEKMGPLRKVNTLQHPKNSFRRSYTKFKRSFSPGSNNASKRYIRSSDKRKEQAKLLSERAIQSPPHDTDTLPLKPGSTNQFSRLHAGPSTPENHSFHSFEESSRSWTALSISSPCLVIPSESCQQNDYEEGIYSNVGDPETIDMSSGTSPSTSSQTSSSLNPGDNNPVMDSDEDNSQLITSEFDLLVDQLTFTEFTANQTLRIETEDEVTCL